MTKKRVILLVLLIAALAAIARQAKAKQRSEWHGLTEQEVRLKLDAKLPGKIPAEKRSEISDKVVAKMRVRGAISDDAEIPDDAGDLDESTEELATS